MKKFLLASVLAAVSGVVFAQATPDSAKAMIESQSTEILQELRSNQALYQSNPAAFNQFINSRVAPSLAFDRMAEIALGRHLQAVREAGKFEAFSAAFRELLVRVYSKSWTQFTNAQINILGLPTVDKYNRAKVRAQVVDNAGKKHQVEFALWYDAGMWKVYDATFANISLLSGYRNTFDTEIQNSGVDALIAKMRTME